MSEKKVVPMEAHTNPALADLLASSDPVVAGFMARHSALLERVTVLERALEKIIVASERNRTSRQLADLAREVL